MKLLHNVQEMQPLDFEIDQEPNNEIQNAVDSESSLGSDSDMENNYVIEVEQQGHHLERTPCTQYQHDVDLDCDVNSGWVRLEQDMGPPVVHDFEGVHRTCLDINNKLLHLVSILINFSKTKCGLSSVKMPTPMSRKNLHQETKGI